MSHCWKCGKVLEEFTGKKMPFRTSCDKCGSDQHCCVNCKYFKRGLLNDCLVPGTDYVADREKSNFCEEFSLLGKAPSSKDDSVKKRFDDLFN